MDESASLTTPRPPTTERCVALNRGPWVAARPPLEELDDPGGATVLDVRPVEEFAAGHATGAISVALDGGSFATRAAFVLEPDEPFVVQARTRDEAEQAVELLWSVGLFAELGCVIGAGGAETTPTVTVPELARLLEADPGLQVLDVREDAERDGATRDPVPPRSAPRPARSTGRGPCTRSARAARARPSPRACSPASASTRGRWSAAAWPSSTASARASSRAGSHPFVWSARGSLPSPYDAAGSVNTGAVVVNGVVYRGSGYAHLGLPGWTGSTTFYAFSLEGK